MVNNPMIMIIILLGLLAVVILLLTFVDKYTKSGSGKKVSEKKNETKPESKPIPVEKPIQNPVPENQTKPLLKIYNSELADDLNEMLKENNTTQSSRLQIEDRVKRESNISKYIKEKNYHNFDFDNVENNDALVNSADDNKPMTFTREDYKRFMALSNIDDKK